MLKTTSNTLECTLEVGVSQEWSTEVERLDIVAELRLYNRQMAAWKQFWAGCQLVGIGTVIGWLPVAVRG